MAISATSFRWHNGHPFPLCGTVMASCLCGSFFATFPCWGGGNFLLFSDLPALPCLLQSTLFVTYFFAPGICKEPCGLLFDISLVTVFVIIFCQPSWYIAMSILLIDVSECFSGFFLFLAVLFLLTGFTGLTGLRWNTCEL